MSQTRIETRNKAESMAHADFKSVWGKVLYVEFLKGYANNGDTGDFDFSTDPIAVLVKRTPTDDIENWQGAWLDPLWSVKPLEKREGMTGFHGWEMYGNSYSMEGTTEPTKYRQATRMERFKLALQKKL